MLFSFIIVLLATSAFAIPDCFVSDCDLCSVNCTECVSPASSMHGCLALYVGGETFLPFAEEGSDCSWSSCQDGSSAPFWRLYDAMQYDPYPPPSDTTEPPIEPSYMMINPNIPTPDLELDHLLTKRSLSGIRSANTADFDSDPNHNPKPQQDAIMGIAVLSEVRGLCMSDWVSVDLLAIGEPNVDFALTDEPYYYMRQDNYRTNSTGLLEFTLQFHASTCTGTAHFCVIDGDVCVSVHFLLPMELYNPVETTLVPESTDEYTGESTDNPRFAPTTPAKAGSTYEPFRDTP